MFVDRERFSADPDTYKTFCFDANPYFMYLHNETTGSLVKIFKLLCESMFALLMV